MTNNHLYKASKIFLRRFASGLLIFCAFSTIMIAIDLRATYLKPSEIEPPATTVVISLVNMGFVTLSALIFLLFAGVCSWMYFKEMRHTPKSHATVI